MVKEKGGVCSVLRISGVGGGIFQLHGLTVYISYLSIYLDWVTDLKTLLCLLFKAPTRDPTPSVKQPTRVIRQLN